MRRPFGSLALATVLLLTGCGTDLLPPEEFRWCERSAGIHFQPPGAPWKRSKLRERETGVSFVLPDVPPGLITVGEFLAICHQDQRPALVDVLERFDELSPAAFQSALRAARRYNNAGFSQAGNETIVEVNELITQALSAHRRRDLAVAREIVERALESANALEYGLDELVDRYLFDPSESEFANRYDLDEPIAGNVAGLPSIDLHYRLDDERGPHVGSKIYVAWDNRLFVFSYLGPKRYLGAFEAVMETVSFGEPAGSDDES